MTDLADENKILIVLKQLLDILKQKDNFPDSRQTVKIYSNEDGEIQTDDLEIADNELREILEAGKRQWLIMGENLLWWKRQLKDGVKADLDMIFKETEEIVVNRLKRYSFLLNHLENKGNSKGFNENQEGEFNLETIKQIPVGDLIEEKGKKIGKDIFFKCPLHNEKTASFSWNPGKNLWHCFSCQKGGSVIDFVMARDNCDLIMALKILSSYLRSNK